MAIIRLNDVDDNVSDLLKDAADRVGMKKHAYINKQLERLAAREYEQQQKESKSE